VLDALPYSFRVIVVNDGSTDDTLPLLEQFQFNSAHITYDIVKLDINEGHQAAIYEGFLHALRFPGDHFIVMDCDGQDPPTLIPALLAQKDAPIVHVVRNGRPESVFFKFGYYCYKALFRMLTGRQMNYGNFCLVNRAVATKAVVDHFTHLAAFLSRQEDSKSHIVAERGKRLGGKSKMGFRKLLRHAASSFAEYGYGGKSHILRKITFR
jgi:polyisoprenyl-phosphate glycosyltransferase